VKRNRRTGASVTHDTSRLRVLHSDTLRSCDEAACFRVPKMREAHAWFGQQPGKHR
jgi:hypothetical protein